MDLRTGGELISDFVAAWRESDDLDMWVFGKRWALRKLSEEGCTIVVTRVDRPVEILEWQLAPEGRPDRYSVRAWHEMVRARFLDQPQERRETDPGGRISIRELSTSAIAHLPKGED
ncbi:hypothetical protein [Amycolatopsis arida]|nr:hypothetical protein [Amycolatopsis arida]